MDLEDEALVDRYRQTGDASFFKSLVRRYQNRIYNSAYRMLGNKEEAEEVVQDTFVKVHNGLSGFRRQASFAAWLFRISHNLCIDNLRSRKRQRGLLFFFPSSSNADGDGDRPAPELRDDGPDPQQIVDLSEQSSVVAGALAKLPESQRAVLVLHDMEGFSYQDIASIVGTSIGTVRSRLHYGRLKMRELLEPYFSPEGETARSR
ncbi:MAG: RNA polymerase sigma factor [Candidatus Obscuribacterales bacterium]